jgi:hypothetical protein
MSTRGPDRGRLLRLTREYVEAIYRELYGVKVEDFDEAAEAISAAYQALDALAVERVRSARVYEGKSWRAIGAAFGMSGQAAHKRFSGDM